MVQGPDHWADKFVIVCFSESFHENIYFSKNKHIKNKIFWDKIY